MRTLQERDEEKKENEKAKNSLEAFIFETRDTMQLETIITVSTDKERQETNEALSEAADWLDEDGYTAETSVYKKRLRDLKRTVRPIFRRLSEAEKRPKLIAEMKDSLNLSHDFINWIRNLSDEVQIFTEVEMSKLENITYETEVIWCVCVCVCVHVCVYEINQTYLTEMELLYSLYGGVCFLTTCFIFVINIFPSLFSRSGLIRWRVSRMLHYLTKIQ